MSICQTCSVHLDTRTGALCKQCVDAEVRGAIAAVYVEVCLLAERNMEATATVAGAHWNALRTIMEQRGLLATADLMLETRRKKAQR